MESFSEEEYFYKVENMVLSSAHVLRKLFAERWKKKTNKDWEHTKEQGIIFMNSREGNSIDDWISEKQKNLIKKGCLADMDVTLLATMLRSFNDQVYKEENETVGKLTELRNKQHHHPSGKLSQKKYNKNVAQFRKILSKLRVESSEIEKIIEKAEITSTVGALEAATKLLKEAHEHMKAKEFEKAIDCYTKAKEMPCLLPSHKVVVHEKCAECYLKQAELIKHVEGNDSENLVHLAMRDGFSALKLNESSWNALYLIAQCHQWNGCYDEATRYYKRVLALSPHHENAKSELEKCNKIPRKKPRYDVDPHSSRLTYANVGSGSEVMKRTEQQFLKAASPDQKYIITIVELEEFLNNDSTSSLPSSSSWTSWLKPNASRKALVFCTGRTENRKLDGLTDGAVDEMEAINALEKDTTNSMQVLTVKTSNTANFIEKIGSTSRQIVVVTEETKAVIQARIKNITELEEDEIRWSDLTTQFAQEIEGRITLFQNTPIQLNALLKLHGNNDDNLVTKLNGKFLASLILDQSPSLFNNSVPPLFPYYIPRQILSQARISNEVFRKQLPDIFLFAGIRLHDLSTLVGFSETEKGRRTDTSTNQITQRNVRVRFLVLLLKDHFEEICNLTSAPVHWLQFENAGFKWVKSRGNIDSLHSLVDGNEKQCLLSEDDFVEYLCSDKPVHRSKMPVCIADTPGMGKSSLLACVGRALMSRDPRKLVLFANFTELVAQVKSQVQVSSDLSEELLINVLSNFLKEHDNELAISLFQNGLKNGSLNIELLLDGYDEVNTQEFQLANECLRCLIEKFVSVRIIVSTRPHLLLSLENILQTVGFKIEPFSKQDQIEFLVKFWKAKQQPDKIVDSEKLERFGEHCLKIIESKISTNDRNIAGIPLLCLLIAEVYQKNAVNYSDPDNFLNMGDEDLTPVEVDITSITDLFKHVIEVKFELYYKRHKLNSSSSDKVQLMNAHIVESLRVLFPNNSNIPQKWTQDAIRYPAETLLKVGILEKGSTEQAPRFIHRSFAEYFVSVLVMNNFKEKKKKDDAGVDEMTKFIFSVVLSTTGVELNFYNHVVMLKCSSRFPSACTFTFQLTVHFINQQLHKPDSLQQANYKDVSQQVGTSDIALACAHDDHPQLFRYLLKFKFFELDKHTLLRKNLWLVIVRKSGAEMLDLLMEEFDELENLFTGIHFQLLKAAAKLGKHSVLERLCLSHRFRQVIEQNHEENGYLLQVAIENTWLRSSQPGGNIEQRIQIVRLFLQINPQLINNFDNQFCVVSYQNIHICILLELLKPEYRADLLLPTKYYGKSVLQYVADYLTDEQFHTFVQNIPKPILQQMLKAHDENDQKPLHLRLMNCSQPLPTLSLLSSFGLNPLEPGNLESAFIYGRSSVCLRTLINFWSSWHSERKVAMYSALHHSARKGNQKLVELFLSFGMDVNASDQEGNTPIFYAVAEYWGRDTRTELEVLEELMKSGDELTKLNARNQTLLHIAVQGREPDTVKFLLENGLAGVLNAQDSDGNTPLHAAVKGCRDHDIITLLVELGADVNATNHSNHTPIMGLLSEHCWGPKISASMALLIFKGAEMSEQIATFALKVAVCENERLEQEEYEWLVNKCLQKGGDLKEKDSKGQSLLHHAAYIQCLRGVQFLLSRGLKPNMKDNDGNTPLHIAISSHYFKNEETQFQLAKLLVDADSSTVNVCNRDGKTALSAITNSGHLEFLDSKLVELLQCPPETARKIMELIIKNNDILPKFDKELASTLIKCGAELNWKTESGTTWLHMAMYNFSLDALRFFVEQGIHPDVQDNAGNPPSHHFVASLDKNILYQIYPDVVNPLNFLVQLGADVKAVNTKGESLLHLSAHQGNFSAVEYLLSMGCDVNAPGGSDGDTVLHYCFMQKWHENQFRVIFLLFKSNANVNATNMKLDSVADFAIKAFRESFTEWDGQDILFINQVKFVEAINLMIDQELDLSRKTTKGGLFLHLISSFLDSSQFHQVVEHVISKGKEKAFLLLDESNQNFIEVAQEHFTVLEETLTLVNSYGLDIQG